ncbi:MAG: carboxy terminal-processing peptidase [Gammaproteobacteria bacterium]|nr:carboxy terminal-processing peptidase [Gammaproteobacteria bacterium]
MTRPIKQLLAILLIAGTLPALAVPTTVDPSELYPSAEQERATKLVHYFIDRFHYRDVQLDDALSERIFARYLENLDGNRSYLMAPDLEDFARYRLALDDAIRETDLAAAFDIFKRVRQRVEERVEYAASLLDAGFDFTVDEEVMLDRSQAPWAADREALNEIWRQRVKNDWLTLSLSGKSDDEIVENLSGRYERIQTRIHQLDREDVFQTFINAYAGAIEPHTSYLARRASDNFNINMSLSLEGIGAALQTENEHTVVRRVIPGAPADLSNRLFVGDRITGVAQGGEDMVDIVGWRLAEVVDLIRGPKGSTVRLEILPADEPLGGSRREIDLVRDKVKLEGRAAHSTIHEVPTSDGMDRIAVIRIPTFYSNLEARARGEKDFRSTTRDVRNILRELRGERVNGVVIDLLGNSGGSLPEAIELTGLFIARGPVVQVRDSLGRVNVSRDPDPDIVYSGPLAVLVDRYSASASEIFAGAIQDYERGVLIGESTYGKGTVQRVENLGNGPEMGKLKYTIAKFFRISGDSTQLRGVTPDIEYPMAINNDSNGERAFDNALPWEAVNPARYEVAAFSALHIPDLVELHRERTADDLGFEYLRSEAQAASRMEGQRYFSLNRRERERTREQLDNQRLRRLNLYRESVGEAPLATLEELSEEQNTADPTDVSDAHRVKQEEAANILSDLIRLQRRQLMTQSVSGDTQQDSFAVQPR